ncbi:tyrosine-protein phosphatase [Candidatus Clostridium radicumherbarum]|uniref:protein-tyrosine-phosphatase n=1 Tax=Candidatus Clostridium radicumherbarum TaxID=3381662 RepID=A0ABW8TSY8_9CLOT
MIDFHSHILPYLDDGSKNYDMSFDMLKLSAEEGTEFICATSHFIPEELEQNKKHYYERLESIINLAKTKNISINILPGLELYLHPELPKYYSEKRIWGINLTPYVLIELPMQQFPMYTDEVFYELRLQGAMPIIAHPERNFKIMKDEGLLKNLIEQGTLAQINSGSLTGIYGKDIQTFALNLVERNMIHLIGSDAHDDKRRTTRLADALEIIKNKNPELYAWMDENQYKIIEGKEVDVLDIKPNKKRFDFWGLRK